MRHSETTFGTRCGSGAQCCLCLLLLLVLVAVLPETAGALTVSGRVTAADGSGLSGAAITIVQVAGENPPWRTTTAADGTWSVSDGTLFGNLQVTAAKTGYAMAPASREFLASVNTGGVDFTGTLQTPVITGVTALNLRGFSVTLSGQVDPRQGPAQAWFEWGPTPAFGQETPPASLAASGGQTLNASVTGLSPGMIIHFRMVAVNGSGRTESAGVSLKLPRFPATTLLFPWWTIDASYPPGSAAVVDMDASGTMDILYTPGISASLLASLNHGNGTFSRTGAFLGLEPLLCSGTMDCQDANHDGTPDKLGSCGTESWTDHSLIMGSLRDFDMIRIPRPESHPTQLEWIDTDNDGQMEILCVDYGAESSLQTVYHQHMRGRTVVPRNFPAEESSWCSFAAGDPDGDGRRDVLCLFSGPVNGIILNRNRPGGFVSEQLHPAGAHAWAAWADWDQDGREDVVFTRSDESPILWRNNGTGFTPVPSALASGPLRPFWGDFNNDGRLDLLFHGPGANGSLWYNTPSGFVMETDPLPVILGGGDFDGDGRLDLVCWRSMAGCSVFQNESGCPANTPPAPPVRPRARIGGTEVFFEWDPGDDAETPAASLAYNVRAGTTPGGIDLLAPMSLPDGRRLKPDFGNARWSRRLPLRISSLAGRTVYWSVQSIDGAFAASPFTAELAMTIPAGPMAPVPGDSDADGIVSQAEFDAVLAHYRPNYPPGVEQPVFGGSTPLEFSLGNFRGFQPEAEASSDLNTWEPLGPAQFFYRISDPAAGTARRFYRLKWPE